MRSGAMRWRPLLLPAALAILLAASPQRARADATDRTAAERGLLETIDLKAAVLAEEGPHHYRGVAERNFKGPVLGYVTPWNPHGYDVATQWRAKFTHISPVWYQLKGDGAGGFKLAGGHDADSEWIEALREPVTHDADCSDGDSGSETCSAAGLASVKPPLVVPRFIVELDPQGQVALLASRPGEAIALVVDEVVAKGFDGMVLEAWLSWEAMGGMRDEGFSEAALGFVKKLAASLHDKGKVLILAVPPVDGAPGRPAASLEQLQRAATDVDGLSVMTYDYSAGAAAAGPNAPLAWQRRNAARLLERPAGGGLSAVSPHQVLLGLNFYGYDFSRPEGAPKGAAARAEPVMGPAFLAALRRHKPKLRWDDEAAEHYARYKAGGHRHTVYCPTPASVAARVEAAAEAGVGLSIWELGQGMDSFLDLL